MQANDLSKEIKEAIIIEAEQFHPDLALQFKMLADECDTEIEYKDQAIKLIREMKSYDEEEREDIFFDYNPSTKEFIAILDAIELNISILN